MMGAETFTVRYCWTADSAFAQVPPYEVIAQIFRGAAAGGEYGTFSAPRIVRIRNGTCTWDLTATAVLSWPSEDPSVRAPVVAAAQAALYDAIEHQRRNARSLVMGEYTTSLSNGEFSPAINGSLAWWTSGQAANSRTRNAWDSPASTDPNENPIGPDSLVPEQGSSADFFGRAFRSIAGNMTPIAIGLGVVAVAGVAIFYGPEIKLFLRSRGGSEPDEPDYPPPGYRPVPREYYAPQAGSAGYRRR